MLPKQTQTTKFKLHDKNWGKETINHYISLSSFSNGGISDNKRKIQECFDAYDGRLDMSQYNYVTTPYGSSQPENIGFPAKIRNYNIIYPLVNIIYGEYTKKPKNYIVVAKDSEIESKMNEQKQAEVTKFLQQQYVAQLQQQGIETGQEIKQEDLEKGLQAIEQKYSQENWKDEKTITGQHALDYIVEEKKVINKFKKGFLNWLISGYVFSEKTTHNNDIDYSFPDVRDVDHDNDPNIDFVEDGEWATVRNFASISKVLDIYNEDLKEEEIIELESQLKTGAGSLPLGFTPTTNPNTNYTNNPTVEVIRVYWKSKKKVGFLSYIDMETGKPQEMEVDESYQLDKEAGDISIQWEWRNESWEGTRIAGKYFVRIRPCLIQRDDIDNPSITKLPINGRSFYKSNNNFLSLVYLGIPFQVMYNIYKYRQEKAIAKAKDKMAYLYMSHKPETMKLEEWLTYGESLGFIIVDDTSPDYQASHTNGAQLDLGFSQSLSILNDIINLLKQEWEELAGITRQRKGQTQASQTATSAQQDLGQSYVSTEIYNTLYEEFEQTEYQGLLEVSKYAWVEGKKAQFYLPDTGMINLNIDGLIHAETNYGVFVVNSAKEKQKLETMRSLADRMFQSQVPFDLIAGVVESENMAQIKKLGKKFNELQQQSAQSQQEGEQAILQAELEGKLTLQQMIEENANRRNTENNTVKLEIAEMTALAIDKESIDTNSNGVPDIIDIAEHSLKERQLNLKEKEIALKDRHHKEDLAMEEKNIKSKEKIARQRPKSK